MAYEPSQLVVSDLSLDWFVSQVFLSDSTLMRKAIDMKDKETRFIDNGHLLNQIVLFAFLAEVALNPPLSLKLETLIIPKTVDEGMLVHLLLPCLPTRFTDKLNLLFDPEKSLKVGKSIRNRSKLSFQYIEQCR